MTVDTTKELPYDASGIAIQGAIRQDASGALVDDGEYTPLQVDANGAVKCVIV